MTEYLNVTDEEARTITKTREIAVPVGYMKGFTLLKNATDDKTYAEVLEMVGVTDKNEVPIDLPFFIVESNLRWDMISSDKSAMATMLSLRFLGAVENPYLEFEDGIEEDNGMWSSMNCMYSYSNVHHEIVGLYQALWFIPFEGDKLEREIVGEYFTIGDYGQSVQDAKNIIKLRKIPGGVLVTSVVRAFYSDTSILVAVVPKKPTSVFWERFTNEGLGAISYHAISRKFDNHQIASDSPDFPDQLAKSMAETIDAEFSVEAIDDHGEELYVFFDVGND